MRCKQMPRQQPLKVYRTSIGFQDAYVAATSQKAALQAWGTTKNLFGSGLAERVTDPKLTKAALARPGIVVRTARGTMAEHLAAAGKMKRSSGPAVKTSAPREREKAPPPKPKRRPRPSRARLDKAEDALDHKRGQLKTALTEVDAKIEALRRERDRLRSAQEAEIDGLEKQRAKEEMHYRRALDEWEG